MAHITRNTDQEYPCLMCGSPGNIVRESPDPRIKCTSCNFTYDASQSAAAVAADQIPDEPIELQHPEEPAPQEQKESAATHQYSRSQNIDVQGTLVVPRTPSYVFLSKKRDRVQFTTKRDLKKVTLLWETTGKAYDCYELQPRQVSANIEIK